MTKELQDALTYALKDRLQNRLFLNDIVEVIEDVVHRKLTLKEIKEIETTLEKIREGVSFLMIMLMK